MSQRYNYLECMLSHLLHENQEVVLCIDLIISIVKIIIIRKGVVLIKYTQKGVNPGHTNHIIKKGEKLFVVHATILFSKACNLLLVVIIIQDGWLISMWYLSGIACLNGYAILKL